MIYTPNILKIPDHVDVISWKAARRIIENHHYLGYAPKCMIINLGVYVETELIGVMMFGHPIARLEDQKNTLELTRMFLFDSPKNSESRALSLAEKWIKLNYPIISRLIAYSDTDQGHNGTIYKAANWKLVGSVRPHTWSSRPKRRGVIGGKKLKFERILRKDAWVSKLMDTIYNS